MFIEQQSSGPTENARRRIIDATHHIANALGSYHEPEDFVRHVNAAIQELRNSTFVLQKVKAVIPGFDSWYAQWQKWMEGNPVLRWLVDSRNTIVKRSDLALNSRADIEIVYSYLSHENLRSTQLVHGSKPTASIAEDVRANLRLLHPELPIDGMIRIKRTWIDPSFGDHELLSVLTYCATCLGTCIFDCHDRLLRPNAELPSIDCVQAHLDGDSLLYHSIPAIAAIAVFELNSGQRVAVATETSSKEIGVDEIKKRYGYAEQPVAPKPGSSAIDHATFYLEQARKIMLADGHHCHIALLFKNDSLVKTVGLKIENNSIKFLMWNAVAIDIAESQADMTVIIGEAWMSPATPETHRLGAANSLERREVLQVIVLQGSGDCAHLFSHIGRVEGKPILGPTQNGGNSVPHFATEIINALKKNVSGSGA